MERLTYQKRYRAGYYKNQYAEDSECINRLGQYEDLKLMPNQLREIDQLYRKMCEELARYQKLEEQGLLIPMPCKLGATIYDYREFFDGAECPEAYVSEAYPIEISEDENGEIVYCIDSINYYLSDFGKTVFLSEEAAEKALEAREKTQSSGIGKER